MLAQHWSLDPTCTFLNHGSFGATPIAVLEHQAQMRARMEAQPVRFYVREYGELLEEAQRRAADFVDASFEDVVMVDNATSGVNAVLRSLDFSEGDELLVTNHEYNACRNVLNFVAGRTGATVKVVDIPYPISGPGEVTSRVVDAFSDRTKLLLLDHITSQTAFVLPIAEIVGEANARGIETLIDGAHAPGMLDLSIRDIDPTYYTGNFHKWVCSPKSGAFLYVRNDRREAVRPTVISHGANQPKDDVTTFFHGEFGWTGTRDPTPVFCIPYAIDVMASFVDGGWPQIRRRNHELCLQGRDILCETLGVDASCPDEMIGSIATVPLPDGSAEKQSTYLYLDPQQNELLFDHGIEVPIIPWPTSPKRLLRISAQLYNTIDDYKKLASVIQ